MNDKDIFTIQTTNIFNMDADDRAALEPMDEGPDDGGHMYPDDGDYDASSDF